MSVQTEDILACEPLYEDTAIGTTSTGFKKHSMQTTGIPIAVQVFFNGQRLALQIANNTPQIAVLNQARVHFGQDVEFAPHQPLPLVPNKVYLLQPTSGTESKRNRSEGSRYSTEICRLEATFPCVSFRERRSGASLDVFITSRSCAVNSLKRVASAGGCWEEGLGWDEVVGVSPPGRGSFVVASVSSSSDCRPRDSVQGISHSDRFRSRPRMGNAVSDEGRDQACSSLHFRAYR
jgi:hypothetical protein